MTETTDFVLTSLRSMRAGAEKDRERAAADVVRIDRLIQVHLHGNSADPLAPLPPNVVDSRLTPRFCPECGGPVDDKATGHLIHARTGQLHCGPADPEETGAFRMAPDGPGQPQTEPAGEARDA